MATTFNCYNSNGVRIIAKKVNGGFQLIKFDFNRTPDFQDTTCGTVQLRGEFLRNGRIWSNARKMHLYVTNYRKHALRDFSGVPRPRNSKDALVSRFDIRENRRIWDKQKAMFGSYHNI